jgi:hypothetical protein
MRRPSPPAFRGEGHLLTGRQLDAPRNAPGDPWLWIAAISPSVTAMNRYRVGDTPRLRVWGHPVLRT